jgi:hypothetical protein
VLAVIEQISSVLSTPGLDHGRSKVRENKTNKNTPRAENSFLNKKQRGLQ